MAADSGFARMMELVEQQEKVIAQLESLNPEMIPSVREMFQKRIDQLLEEQRKEKDAAFDAWNAKQGEKEKKKKQKRREETEVGESEDEDEGSAYEGEHGEDDSDGSDSSSGSDGEGADADAQFGDDEDDSDVSFQSVPSKKTAKKKSSKSKSSSSSGKKATQSKQSQTKGGKVVKPTKPSRSAAKTASTPKRKTLDIGTASGLSSPAGRLDLTTTSTTVTTTEKTATAASTVKLSKTGAVKVVPKRKKKEPINAATHTQRGTPRIRAAKGSGVSNYSAAKLKLQALLVEGVEHPEIDKELLEIAKDDNLRLRLKVGVLKYLAHKGSFGDDLVQINKITVAAYGTEKIMSQKDLLGSSQSQSRKWGRECKGNTIASMTKLAKRIALGKPDTLLMSRAEFITYLKATHVNFATFHDTFVGIKGIIDWQKMFSGAEEFTQIRNMYTMLFTVMLWKIFEFRVINQKEDRTIPDDMSNLFRSIPLLDAFASIDPDKNIPWTVDPLAAIAAAENNGKRDASKTPKSAVELDPELAKELEELTKGQVTNQPPGLHAAFSATATKPTSQRQEPEEKETGTVDPDARSPESNKQSSPPESASPTLSQDGEKTANSPALQDVNQSRPAGSLESPRPDAPTNTAIPTAPSTVAPERVLPSPSSLQPTPISSSSPGVSTLMTRMDDVHMDDDDEEDWEDLDHKMGDDSDEKGDGEGAEAQDSDKRCAEAEVLALIQAQDQVQAALPHMVQAQISAVMSTPTKSKTPEPQPEPQIQQPVQQPAQPAQPAQADLQPVLPVQPVQPEAPVQPVSEPVQPEALVQQPETQTLQAQGAKPADLPPQQSQQNSTVGAFLDDDDFTAQLLNVLSSASQSVSEGSVTPSAISPETVTADTSAANIVDKDAAKLPAKSKRGRNKKDTNSTAANQPIRSSGRGRGRRGMPPPTEAEPVAEAGLAQIAALQQAADSTESPKKKRKLNRLINELASSSGCKL
ncbi:hypothetical protein BJ508DRAFT_331143 [Ascobolus immersus RN42]|uniref:Uncharacterized protein n=1 Tax=Ascobolus immersus RN42 TaxID=1160509 RepID=A0A3N4HRK4_ASCIM|nr:hypothetical protein BJ508DRAFT_331143 [Ascobolus immersus RN42]